MATTVIVKGEFINNPGVITLVLLHFVHCVSWWRPISYSKRHQEAQL